MKHRLVQITLAIALFSAVGAFIASPAARASDEVDCSGVKLFEKGTSYRSGAIVVANSTKYRCNSTCTYEPPGQLWDLLGRCKSGTAPH